MSSTVASLFGGGAVSTTDTAATNLKIAGMSTTFNAMLTTSEGAISSLSPSLAGMVDTTELTGAMNKTKALQTQCQNLTPDQCSTKQAQALAETNAAQLNFYKNALAASITNLQAALTSVQNRFSQILSEAAQSPVYKASSIIPEFQALVANIQGDITVLQNSVPYINPPPSMDLSGALSGSSSGSKRPDYALPSVGTKGGYLTQLDQLNTKYDNLMGNPFDMKRIQRIFWAWVYNILIPVSYYTILLFCIVWGGVACSNLFATETFVGNRAWYFFHGMIGFPAVLVYTSIFPPYWVSTIFPAYPRVPKLPAATPDAAPTPDAASTNAPAANSNAPPANSGDLMGS